MESTTTHFASVIAFVGKINLDSAQLESIDALLGPPEAKRPAKQGTAAGASAAASTANAEEEALQRSKISQIKVREQCVQSLTGPLIWPRARSSFPEGGALASSWFVKLLDRFHGLFSSRWYPACSRPAPQRL